MPQDAESRPFFAWIPHLKGIGYSNADIRALPRQNPKAVNIPLYNVLDDAKKFKMQVSSNLVMVFIPVSLKAEITGSSTFPLVEKCWIQNQANWFLTAVP